MKNTLLLILAFFALTACSDTNNKLLDKLQTAVKKEPGKAGYTQVKLESITDFEWDTLYYFAGQVSPEEINDQIGIKWDGGKIPGGHDRLIFVKDNKVVSFVDYDLSEFPLQVFGCNTDQWIYPRNRSMFAAFKYCQGEKEVYAFIPEPCYDNIKELQQNKCTEVKKAE
ncbi:hypothetical protein [Pontibacter fetidus]|uniref:Lipoprotein n=1 Tax=Pontibacter fetidus TaxID=2700082 RepID=A0A6B2H6Q9_9BACT|nr:hypothetical protein [Pontibacter fetidus]NDK56067.1 hypothetical protein [Pontibacter fetidus]